MSEEDREIFMDFVSCIFQLNHGEGFQKHWDVEWESFVRENPDLEPKLREFYPQAWNLAQYWWTEYSYIQFLSERSG